MAPNVAVRLRMFRTTAFSGTSRLPKSRNSTTNVVTTMIPAASGMAENNESFESTSSADGPPTRAGAGAGTARTAWTTASPSSDIGSTDGTTDNQVASGATKRAAAGPAGVAGGPLPPPPAAGSTPAPPGGPGHAVAVAAPGAGLRPASEP